MIPTKMPQQDHLNKLYLRMPIVFGAFPGPRQSHHGYRRNGALSTSIEAGLTLKVPKSELTKFLPRGFRWQNVQSQSPSNHLAYISVVAKKLDGMEWLANKGYNLLSYYVHGVEYTSSEGKIHRGTYLPVLWEDLADPIISGREELGFPKLFANLDFEVSKDGARINASWRQSVFAELHLSGLTEQEHPFSGMAPPDAGIDDGLFLYKYIPAAGRPGVADAEYPVFVPHLAERKAQPAQVTKFLASSEGSVKWSPHDWTKLPTLHHIVKSLADLGADSEKLEVHRAFIVEKRGISDLASASRL